MDPNLLRVISFSDIFTLNTYSLDYILIFQNQDSEVLLVLISPSASQLFPHPSHGPVPRGSPCQCPAPRSPAWPSALLTNPAHSTACPQRTPNARGWSCPCAPSSPLGWWDGLWLPCPAFTGCHAEPPVPRAPSPQGAGAEFKSSLSPSQITHHYHTEHSLPQPTLHHLFPFHCCLSQYALNQFYSTVFPPLTATDPTSLAHYLGHLCFCSVKHRAYSCNLQISSKMENFKTSD